MKKETAAEVVATSLDCTRQTDESVKRVMDSCDEATFKAYRRLIGRIMGTLFTEIIAPLYSQHIDLAPDGFKPMQIAEVPTLRLKKETMGELLALMDHIYERLDGTAAALEETCDPAESMWYRARINEVLVHVAEAKASLLASTAYD